MPENIQFIYTINNRTKNTLKLQPKQGKCNNPPPTEIPPNHSTKPFSCSRAEGTVVYQFGDNADQWIKIYWDVPWVSTTAKVTAETFDEGVSVEISGVESVTITVIDGR